MFIFKYKDYFDMAMIKYMYIYLVPLTGQGHLAFILDFYHLDLGFCAHNFKILSYFLINWAERKAN